MQVKNVTVPSSKYPRLSCKVWNAPNFPNIISTVLVLYPSANVTSCPLHEHRTYLSSPEAHLCTNKWYDLSPSPAKSKSRIQSDRPPPSVNPGSAHSHLDHRSPYSLRNHPWHPTRRRSLTRALYLKQAQEGVQQQMHRKVFVGRCTEDMCADDLRSYFSKFGEVSPISACI